MEYKLKLREFREEKEMTQRQVAKALNLSPGAVAKWETGMNRPTMKNLLALAGLFGCSLDALLGCDGPGRTAC